MTRFALIAFALMLAAPLPAMSQVDREPVSSRSEVSSSRSRRTLNGYTFLLPTRSLDPFITQSVRSHTGLGIAPDVKVSLYNQDGEEVGSVSGDVAFVVQGFAYQHAFGEWLAVRFGVAGAGRLGTDTQSLLAKGVSAIVTSNLGATARIWEDDRFQVSGTLDLESSNVTGIDILGFAQSVIDSGGIPEDAKIVGSQTLNKTTVSVRGAYSPANWVGFTLALEAGTAKTGVDGENNIGVYASGATVGFDLGARTKVPLGILLGLVTDSRRGETLEGGSVETQLGIFYTGRKDFDVGIESRGISISQQDRDEKFTLGETVLLLRYYF